jgi:hypothetical protein
MHTRVVQHRDLATAYDGITAVADGLDDDDLFRATRCAGWTVVDVWVHVLFDAQRALVALASPVDGAPDTDAVSYWRSWRSAAAGAAAHAQFTRITASAYRGIGGLRGHWTETAAAAVRAARERDPRSVLTTQGKVLTVADFLDTLTVEAAVHHLDLTLDLPAAPPPASGPLLVVRRTLDGLLGGAVRADWDDATYALKGTGRLPLTDAERRTLGGQADWFPLFG